MSFNPHNPIVQRCLQGRALEDQAKPEEARAVFLQAWNEATTDFERFLAAYFVARQQQGTDKLTWLQKALELLNSLDQNSVQGVLPSLYHEFAGCYSEMADPEKAEAYRELAPAAAQPPSDKGPFYHGTKADLQTGDLLVPGNASNYQSGLLMNHIYFTALPDGAALAAALAAGEGAGRVYIVEPTGDFENDPNVTDKKFPGNLTRSYRSAAPLRIAGEATGWNPIPPEVVLQWRARLDGSKGEIIN